MKLSTLMWVAMTVCMVGLVGCGDDGHDHKDGDHKDHNHKDDGHKDGDHKDGDHDDHGESHALGTKEAAGMKITAARLGELSEGVLSLTIEGADPATLTVRAWLGVEDASGSVVAQADYEADHKEFHAHLSEVPEKLADDAKWWVEIQKGDDKSVISFDMHKE
jgi:hypothetical protein